MKRPVGQMSRVLSYTHRSGDRDRRGACAESPVTVLSALPGGAFHPEPNERRSGVTTIAHHEPRPVTGGVDTHKDLHVAAVLDELGRLLAKESFPTTRAGYRRLLRWLRSHGELAAVGVEGCGSWGAGLVRFLAARGVSVVEVNRPNRQNRRRRGKSDTVDAEAAARAVLGGQAWSSPRRARAPSRRSARCVSPAQGP